MVNDNSRVGKLPTPIPMNMDVKVSIIAKYKEDVDQIVQNFASVCNPYFVVSWKVPEEFGFNFIDELRIQIEWNGSISYATPNTLSKDDKYRITADTSFTIKGWIFPPTENPEGTIYVIHNKFINASLAGRVSSYDDYPALSAAYTESETISISAYPFLLLGKRFSYSNSWYLSSPASNLIGTFEEIDTVKFPTISAFRLPDSYVSVASDNSATITLPVSSLSAQGEFTFVTSNSAGWTSLPFNLNII
jgi:hypothetical protein